MTWIVPRTPDTLRLALDQHWDGAPNDDPRLRGALAITAEDGGLRVTGGLPDPSPGPAPTEPVGTRVANLWEHDVVELFWVGPRGRYVELELGAHGHFLFLEFRAPRDRANDHADLALAVDHRLDASGWETSVRLPWSLLPRPLVALGGFGIARGAFLAASPLPGDAPDFHQPDRFPRARLAER